MCLKGYKDRKIEQITFVIILILSHVIIVVVVIPVSLIPIPVIRVLAGLTHWLDSEIVGGRGQIVHGDVSCPWIS